MSWGRVWRLMSAWFTLHASMVLKSRPTLWIFSPAGYTPYRGFCVSVGTKNRPASAQYLHPSTKVQQLYGNTWNLCWTTCKQHTQESPWYTLPVLGLTHSFVPFEQGKGAPDAVGAALKRTASTDSTSALTKVAKCCATEGDTNPVGESRGATAMVHYQIWWRFVSRNYPCYR